MKAINNELQALVIELQKFNSVNSFALAGGTSLSIRFNHRFSVDIDLFTNKIVGKTGLLLIVSELKEFYKEALKFSELINEESGDQYCFLRALIKINGIDIKVEFIQNIQFIDPVETYNGIKILSKKDIGLFKLVSASNRKAKKDIYDLDFITDEIQLNDLFEQLEIKSKKYSQEEHKCLFDLDNEVNPINDISLLLEFDNIDYTALPSRPSHSNDMIDIIPQNKSWPAARSSWRLKVRQLMHDMGIPLPPVKPIN